MVRATKRKYQKVKNKNSAYSEYPQCSTVQLWKGLSADVANHVHGLAGQKVEP